MWNLPGYPPRCSSTANGVTSTACSPSRLPACTVSAGVTSLVSRHRPAKTSRSPVASKQQSTDRSRRPTLLRSGLHRTSGSSASFGLKPRPRSPRVCSWTGSHADWGLTWVKVPVGQHSVCFTDVLGFKTPACQTITVAEGATASATGQFAPMGLLKVDINPAGVSADVIVDGTPRNQFGLYFFTAPGTYEVCGTSAAGRATPSCTTVEVAAGTQTNSTLTYAPA